MTTLGFKWWVSIESIVVKKNIAVVPCILQVNEIEVSVESLKRMHSAAESDGSEPSYEATGRLDSSSSHSSMERPTSREPVLRGSSTEEDIPESRVEYDDELSMPSVKNLRSMFNKDQLTEAGVKRVRFHFDESSA